MLHTKEELNIRVFHNEAGTPAYTLSDLSDFAQKNPKMRLFAHVRLQPGEEVSYHVHHGESESYYILKGTGLYQDNQQQFVVSPGTVTFTPDASGHAIRNNGDDVLEFIALVLLD